ncbi:MAG: hypothetical protein WC438_02975 [Candidatus Pacearchaeota archaeon]
MTRSITISNLERIFNQKTSDNPPVDISFIPRPHQEFLEYWTKRGKKFKIIKKEREGYSFPEYVFYDRLMILKMNQYIGEVDNKKAYSDLKDLIKPFLKLNLFKWGAKFNDEDLDIYIRKSGFVPLTYFRAKPRKCYIKNLIF